MFTPFTPGQSVALDVTSTSARVLLPNPGTGPRTIMITEALGLELAFIALGDVTVTAVVPTNATPVNGFAILPGSKEPITVSPGQTHLAAITASGTATLYITSGDGI